MIDDLIAKWAISAIQNAPVLFFMGIALWDLRKALTRYMAFNEALLQRLLDKFLEGEDNSE